MSRVIGRNFTPALRSTAGIFCLSALIACTATGEKTDSVASAATDSAKNPDAVRCQSVARTGTRIRSKICKTNRQWAEQARDAREATEQIQRESTHSATVGGG